MVNHGESFRSPHIVPPEVSRLTTPAFEGCEPSQAVSALSDEDQGTTNLLNNLFQLPPSMVQAAFGSTGMDINGTAKAIPPEGTTGIVGPLECYKRCNITQ